ncbi:MAG: HD domain-containing phosphohydrolase [Tepidisphaeraceae bacterium]
MPRDARLVDARSGPIDLQARLRGADDNRPTWTPPTMSLKVSSNFATAADPATLRLSEVISALSFALDLVEGQPEGHAVRSCLLGMRLAREVGVPREDLRDLFYALLLKDVGCSSNSAKVCYLFEADDRVAKQELKTTDWSSMLRSVGYIARNVAPAGSLWQKTMGFLRVARAGTSKAKELVNIRCERGATIVRELGLSEATAEAIYALDEHWDGNGHPHNLRGTGIPLAARIIGLAQTFEVFCAKFGNAMAYEVSRQRCNTWFDPDLVAALRCIETDEEFWRDYNVSDPRIALPKYEPEDRVLHADEARLDRTASAFAKVIDAKSPWTYCHSEGVAEVACGIAKVMGLMPAQVREIRRAGLLHDIGKLGISNLILDKPSKLNPEEMAQVRKHPAYTRSILDKVGAFRSFADLAAAHHERLDGKGYHRGIDAGGLSTAARILCVADMYEALAAKRPYRQDLTHGEVFGILNKNKRTGLCPQVLAALTTFLDQSGITPVRIAA